MANATKYVDNVNGNNGNTGDSEAQAYADIPTALAAITGGGNTIYVQAGSDYVLTSTITMPVALKGDSTDGRNRIIGYTTTPGASDGRPIITSATNSVHFFTCNDNDWWEFKHLHFIHTAGTRGQAFAYTTTGSGPFFIKDCIFDGLSALTTGSAQMATCYLEGVEIKNCTSTTAALVWSANSAHLYLWGCDIHDNVGDGIRCSGTGNLLNVQDSIIDSNGGHGINYTTTTGSPSITLHGNVIVDNTGDGLTIAATSGTVTLEFENNVFYGNGGYGIENNDEQALADLNMRINRNNAFGSNTSGAYTGIAAGEGEVTLTGDPFTNRAGRDFTPDNTASEGAALRAAAYPGAYISGTTTDYKDIGIQHQDSGGVTTVQGVIGGGM